MSTLDHSRYPSFLTNGTELESDVTSDNSDRYAEVATSVDDHSLPPQHRRHRPWWRQSFITPTPTITTNAASRTAGYPDYKDHCRRLKKVHQKLQQRNKAMAKVVAVMCVSLLLSLIPVLAGYPAVLQQVLHFLGAHTAPFSGCTPIAEYFPSGRYQHCYSSRTKMMGGGGVDLWCIDVETALCLLTATKNDMDHRTETLDTEVYSMRRRTEERLNTSVTENSDNVISAVYSRRPSIHLAFYYSAESGQNRRKGLHTLQWRGTPGLAAARNVETEPSNQHVALKIHVTHPGYYYVYCHVIYSPSQGNGAGAFPVSVMWMNKHRHKKVILASYKMSNTDESFLNGVFKLLKGDTVYVRASYDHIDTINTENTFFGAFRI